MTLRCVTISGADDGVNPSALVALSREFPFVEWGILFSPKRTGTPRYPSQDWVHRMILAWGGVRPLPIAAHLCGQFARDTFAGRINWLNDCHEYPRIQLNGFAECSQEIVTALAGYRGESAIILQASSDGVLSEAAEVAARLLTSDVVVSALWDESGGRGLQLVTAPAPPQLEDGCSDLPTGYAGGIGPHNVVDVLRAVEHIAPNSWSWIDMESGVRTDDRFDLEKVRRVLALAAPFFEGGSHG